jgi:hypothetical protein
VKQTSEQKEGALALQVAPIPAGSLVNFGKPLLLRHSAFLDLLATIGTQLCKKTAKQTVPLLVPLKLTYTFSRIAVLSLSPR